MYSLRILLLLVDRDSPELNSVFTQLSILAMRHHASLVPAWNTREAARYIETYKSYENKSADLIRGRTAPGLHCFRRTLRFI